ncbi:30S ribosomal protein S12 methylthiotransferase RimO [candidate division GN15 bacterium]|nr:30S ribosomal protein S12 methylthiotransferase RimO [candidate division GN15 bacterium]
MRVYLHRLGCPKNDVDADYIAARLTHDGHVFTDDATEAEAIIVNTCGFIADAKEESIEAILELAEYKTAGTSKSIYVTGCLSQRYGEELLAEIPEVDAVFGLGALDDLAAAIGGQRQRAAFLTDARSLRYLGYATRQITDNLPYAFVKISDGCNRRCSYCAIPSIRGDYRSRPIDSIVNEARFLAEHGKRELILVSQEATLYGNDLGKKGGIVKLLQALDEVEGVEWIRLMYLHPAQLTGDLISYIASSANKTVPYFDLPLQHINDRILTAMKRHSNRAQIQRLVESIRKVAPAGTLRTTFIVGFPGETDAEFGELMKFVEEVEFDRLGAFVYCAEEGTSAAALPEPVPAELAHERLDQLMLLQQDIAMTANKGLIGSTRDIIIDRLDAADQAVGRTQGDCPDIDQEVIVRSPDLEVGQIIRAHIVDAQGYDLYGQMVED